MVLFDYYEENEASVRIIRQLSFEDGTVFSKAEKKELYELFIRTRQLNPLWNKVFRRECVDFGEDYGPFEDIIKGNDCFQMIPILTNADRILYRNRALYHYNRCNTNSLSHTVRMKTYFSLKKLWERKRQYLDVWGIRDAVLADYAAQGWEVVIMLLTRILSSKSGEIGVYDFLDLITGDAPFSEIIRDLPFDQLSRLDRTLAQAIRRHDRKAVYLLVKARSGAVKARAALKR